MATIGEELRRERHRKGLTIKDAEQVLHIRSAYLEALEENDYKLIPGDIYVKGFIRNYANFLGLNGQEMVNAYKLMIGEEIVVNIKTVRKRAKEKIDNYREEEVHRRLNYDGRMMRRKKMIQRERMIVAFFLLFVILFLLWLFFF